MWRVGKGRPARAATGDDVTRMPDRGVPPIDRAREADDPPIREPGLPDAPDVARVVADATRGSRAQQPPEGYMTAEMIASALARVTGKRAIPASTIRGMASREQLPAPSEHKWGRRNLWAAEEIEQWLRERESRHVPRATVRQIQRRLTAIDEQSRASGNDARLKQAVRSAYRRGLSFQQIADAILVKRGDRHPSREAVRLRFGPYL